MEDKTPIRIRGESWALLCRLGSIACSMMQADWHASFTCACGRGTEERDHLLRVMADMPGLIWPGAGWFSSRLPL